MEKYLNQINSILEALPYIKQFSSKNIVIKYGGAAMTNEDLKDSFAHDIVLLKYVGIHPVIVHGGGPEINQMLKTLQIPVEFVRGHRKTDEKTMEVVEMVLSGKINKQIVSLINSKGGKAIGLSGRDAKLATGEIAKMEMEVEGKMELLDLGLVGTINHVNTELLLSLVKDNIIPVISPVSETIDGKPLNINADTMAGSIAAALKAEKLILLTDTEGVLIQNKLVGKIQKGEANRYIKDGTISGGMIPKVECCLNAIDAGVKRTHIIDGRQKHSILLELLTDHGIGTMVE